MCIAHDPGTRLRDIAARLDITEHSAHGIITDLTAAGYLVKQKDGRRNRYQIQAHPAAAGGWRRELGLLIRSGDARPVAVTVPCAARTPRGTMSAPGLPGG
jgi:DNA-binding IclR family transcriptional regulator